MRTTVRVVLVGFAVLSATLIHARELTFDERVRAQEAIERVYFEHRIYSRQSFGEAVPRPLLERKVRTYLKQSVALELYWKTQVTPEALRRETQRIARGTLSADRLREIYSALGNDPLLFQETFVRASLVDRLTHNFYLYDERFHGDTRAEAERMRTDLIARGADGSDSRARVFEVLRDRVGAAADPIGDEPRRVDSYSEDPVVLSSEAYTRWRAELPARPGEVRPVTETQSAFVVRVLIEEHAGRARVAVVTAPKRSRADWWREVEDSIDDGEVRSVAHEAPIWTSEITGWIEQAGAGRAFGDCNGDDSWENGTLDVLDARNGHTAVWTGTHMLVWGGHDGGALGFLDSGDRYDPVLDSWSPMSTVGAPSARWRHTAVWTGQEMLIWGGSDQYQYLGDGAAYDPATDSWSQLSDSNAPIGRSFHTAVWTGSEMIVWGGRAADPEREQNTGGRYDPSSDQWIPTSLENAPEKRERHTAVWTGSVMVIWGGGKTRWNGGRYDPALDSWSGMSTQGAPEERPDYSAIWTGEEMILWGGYGGSGSSDLDDGGRYDPLQDSWQPVSATGIGSDRHSAVWTGQKMIVWGELNASYDPSTDGWALISDVNDPIDRDDPTAVWTGSQMIVWGGTRFRHVFNSGGRYDPVNDSWTPTAGPPEARAGHSAVWTGSEMLVWGGEVENGYRLDVGSRYDPLLDSWSPMATLDAPEGRADHHAFWTGDRMLVWGGWLDLRSGGRYDPLTDDWTPTSLPGIVPDARDPTAVWTGDEMLVWGGIRSGDCDLYQSDYGARYDPFTDQWQSLAIDDATPEPRFDHVAVWTGSEMIVWGGTALSGPRDEFSECVGRVDFRNGAKYDPGLDRWTAISSADPSLWPLGMDAVWTGTEMIVWNGSNGSRYDPVVDLWTAVSSENDPAPGDTMLWAGSEMIVWGGVSGGRYEPTTDSWRLTSTVDAPVSRNRHTAVWTGEAMIVWGGNYRNNPVNIQIPHFNSGGRYFVGNPDGDHDGVADDCDTCTDTDGDGWGNPGFPGNTCAGDNCPEVPNPTQANGDPDPFGNACDNCPSIDNLDQQDLDADGLGDACDDCALDPDNDADADGICGDVDACPADPDNDADADGQCGDTDCQPADPSDRTPPVVDDLHGEKLVAGAVRLSWSAMGSADAYSLSRGLLTSLPTGDYGACLVDGLVSPSYEDGALPGAGEGFVYLVQAQNDDCGLGALGPDSTGAERLNAAGAACEGASHADSYPVSEASVYGTVSGDLTATAASDGVYESITEEESSGGPPSNRRSLLEHRWTIDVAPGDRIELHVEGSRSSSPDGDDFVFEYSDDGGASWNAIAMSTLPLADDQVDRVGTLPNTLAGSVIFRVVDTNRDEGHLELDELTIDELFVRNVP